MPLAQGSKLGPYEIVGPIGQGGMGEVYRARDTRLDRTVAIKVLSSHLSSDTEARLRFDREARAISSLNHPNVCVLYDVGHQDGTDFFVMEYLEGETLAERLAKGPLTCEQLLKYGIEICEGLEKAHKNGVVHRDLKPSNIMLTKSGAKLMDFGLAKSAPVVTSASSSLTMTMLNPSGDRPLTAEGTIVGTFQYMSPEQVEGKEADARSDIFSFGTVLYEMATAKRAFTGKTNASIVASILAAEPQPISSVQPMSPPSLDRVVKICLAKDPDERWQTAHDVKLQLRWIAEGGSQAGVPVPITARRKNRELALAIAAAMLLVTSVVLSVLYFKSGLIETRTIRAYIKPPADSTFNFSGFGSGFALSPDGLRLAYSADKNGKFSIWIRSIDSLQAQPLPGTDGASFPFWSPDGKWIGFFAGGKLKKIAAAGGPPLTLADAALPRGGSWNRDGIIIFAPSINQPIFRVPDSGGTPVPVTSLDGPHNVTTHRWPQFLPDGRHFIYLSGTPFLPRESPANAIEIASLDSKQARVLIHAHSSAQYASGHLLFVRQNTLMAQAFDPKRLEVSGDAVPISDSIVEDSGTLKNLFSVSDNDTLAYVEGSVGIARQLLLLDREGKKIGQVEGEEGYGLPMISPDGKKISYTIDTSGYDVWTYDLDRNMKTRLTFGSASSQSNLSQVWSPDGKSIAYTCVREGKFGVCRKPSDGSGNEETLLEPASELRYVNDWSRDGKFIALRQPAQGAYGIWILPLTGERRPYVFLQSQFTQTFPAFSPDSKWLAYCSNESGEHKIYVVPFPGPGGKWQISPGSGCSPRWGGDGKELFYITIDNKMMAAEVKAKGSSFEVGSVHELFQAHPYSFFQFQSFDVSADGKRFAIVEPSGQSATAITLVVNWLADVKKK